MALSWFAGSPLVAASTTNHTHLTLPLPDGTASLAGLRRPESLAGSTERLQALIEQLPNMTDMMLRLSAVAVQSDAAVDARVEALLVLQELVEDLDKALCSLHPASFSLGFLLRFLLRPSLRLRLCLRLRPGFSLSLSLSLRLRLSLNKAHDFRKLEHPGGYAALVALLGAPLLQERRLS